MLAHVLLTGHLGEFPIAGSVIVTDANSQACRRDPPVFVDWFGAEWDTLGMVVVSTLAVYFAVLVYTRVAGLRSFTQMSGFDFAVNIALGSLMAATAVSRDPPVAQGVVALGTLYLVQMVIAVLRRHVNRGVNNPSLLLMDGPVFIEEHLRRAKVTKDDLRFKLRQANVFRYDQVRAMVLETTGEVTVLHAGGDEQVDSDLVADVVGAHRLAEQTKPADSETDEY